MHSNLELTKRRKKKLLEILKVLFPEYKYISVRSNGFIWFRKNWASFGSKVNLYELLFTEITKRLSKYRNGSMDYIIVYNDELTDIISTNHKNLIEVLYQEFSNLKKISRVEVLLEDAPRMLQEATTISFYSILSKGVQDTPLSILNGFKTAINFAGLENKRRIRDRYRFAPQLHNIS